MNGLTLSRLSSTTALCLALGAGVFAAGCASTPTHSSFGETVDGCPAVR